jgi:hypothetical protein
MLERLLKRLFRCKDELLRVLERPEIQPHTNASENDMRTIVTKRKISGGTVSGKRPSSLRRHARSRQDLQETPFFDYLGARLGIPGPEIHHLATLVTPTPS